MGLNVQPGTTFQAVCQYLKADQSANTLQAGYTVTAILNGVLAPAIVPTLVVSGLTMGGYLLTVPIPGTLVDGDEIQIRLDGLEAVTNAVVDRVSPVLEVTRSPAALIPPTQFFTNSPAVAATVGSVAGALSYNPQIFFSIPGLPAGLTRGQMTAGIFEYIAGVATAVAYTEDYFVENANEPGRYDIGVTLGTAPSGNEYLRIGQTTAMATTQQVIEVTPFLTQRLIGAPAGGGGGASVGSVSATLVPSQVHELLNGQVVQIGTLGERHRVDVHSGEIGIIVGAANNVAGMPTVAEQRSQGQWDFTLTDDTFIVALQVGTRVSVSVAL